jgi:hypothetical protein
MADHGFKHEHSRRWQLMFGCSRDSVEWNVRDILKPFHQERLVVEKDEKSLKASITSNGGRGPLHEVFLATFDPGAGGCQLIWVECEQVQRSPRRSR